MILVSTLRQIVEKDGFVFVVRTPAHSFTMGESTAEVPARVELFAAKAGADKAAQGVGLAGIPDGVITRARARARAVAHLDPFFAALYTVREA